MKESEGGGRNGSCTMTRYPKTDKKNNRTVKKKELGTLGQEYKKDSVETGKTNVNEE